MEELAVMIYLRCMILRDSLLEGVHNFITDEKGDVNIVSIVVLIGLVVFIAMLFREQVERLIEALFTKITGTAGDAVTTR